MAVEVAEQAIVDELRVLLPEQQVLWRDYDLMLYEYDGSIDKHRPAAVVFPLSTAEVGAVVKACNRLGVPYTARGAGTGLSGGAMPGLNSSHGPAEAEVWGSQRVVPSLSINSMGNFVIARACHL